MRASVSTAQDLGMPAIYLHLLAELLNTIGVDEQDLLLRVGLDPARLQSTDLRVSQTQASEFVTRAIIESGEPGNWPGTLSVVTSISAPCTDLSWTPCCSDAFPWAHN